MKVIAKSGWDTFLVECKASELEYLAGRPVCRRDGYNNYECNLGTTFDIVKAFEQIHRNNTRRADVERVKDSLKYILNGLDMLDNYLDEPKPEEDTKEQQ